MTLEERVKRIEYVLLRMQLDSHIYMGFCVNSSLHPDRKHPHWDDVPEIDWSKDIVHES